MTVGGLVSVPAAGWVLEQTGSFDAVFALFALHHVAGAGLYGWLVGDYDVLAGWVGEEEGGGLTWVGEEEGGGLK